MSVQEFIPISEFRASEAHPAGVTRILEAIRQGGF
jgi:hypothetical protein